MYLSSLLQICMKTGVGTGTTTAGYRLNQVCMLNKAALADTYFHLRKHSSEVLYRSKDSELPDFSKETGAGGEVFFDVRTLVNSLIPSDEV